MRVSLASVTAAPPISRSQRVGSPLKLSSSPRLRCSPSTTNVVAFGFAAIGVGALKALGWRVW